MVLPSLVIVVLILIFLVLFYLIVGTKKFGAKFFRIDSDNVGWVFLSLILFIIGIGSIGNIITTDWPGLIASAPSNPDYYYGYMIGIFLLPLAGLLGGYESWRKAQKIAKQKQTK